MPNTVNATANNLKENKLSTKGTCIPFKTALSIATARIPETIAPSSLHLGETFLVMSSASPSAKTGKEERTSNKNSLEKSLFLTANKIPTAIKETKMDTPPILGTGLV